MNKNLSVTKLKLLSQPFPLTSTDEVNWCNAKGTDIWAMLSASITGDLASIEELLERNPNLLNCSYDYLTPLRFAVRENHIDLVRYFLKKGGNPVVEFTDPLVTLARDRGYAELAALLESTLLQQYQISASGEILPALIRSFDKNAVKSCLQENPDLLHAADARGNKPIHWAALTRQLDLIEHFLDMGADVDSTRPDGARPIDLTTGDYYYRSWYRDLPSTGLRKHEMLIGYLIARGAYYDISVAAKIGHYERVKDLLDQDPSLANKPPLHSGAYSGLPLRNAAGGGFYEIVKLLLERGANPNQSEPGGTRGIALHTAIARRHTEIVKLLLEHGADPNASVESSGNCLSMARVAGISKEITDLIISYGGRLTIELICYYEEMEILSQMLIANPQLPFNNDEHRIMLERRPVVELIMQYQPDILQRFSIRSLDDPDLARWLIKNGLNPNSSDWLGLTPLHRAASEGNIEMASVYLEGGANIDAVDADSFSTPLGWAARNGQPDMVKWLLQKGADCELPRNELWARPFEWARRRGYEDIHNLLTSWNE